jgi:outer membrane protein TolC
LVNRARSITRRAGALTAVVLWVALAVLGQGPGMARAEEAAERELRLEEAITRALQVDLALRSAELSVEENELAREDAAEAVTFTPVLGESYSPAYETAWYGLLTADLQWQMSKKSYAAQEDAVVLETCQKYWAVQGAEEAVEAARLGLEAAELGLRRARAMQAVGLITDADLQAAESQAKQAEAGRAAAERALEAAWEELAEQVGLGSGERPVLVDRPEFAPLGEVSLGHEISRVLETSPQVWQAEQARTLAEWSLSMAYATGGYESYEARQIQQEQVELTIQTTRQAVESGVRNLYRAIRALEDQYAQQEREVAAAEASLKVAEAKFSVGMITRSELLAAELELAQARVNLAATVRQHAYYRLAFQKPWAVSSSGGGS